MSSMMPEQPSLHLPTTIESILFALTVFALLWLLHVFDNKPFTSPLKKVLCPPGGTSSQDHIAEIMECTLVIHEAAPSLPNVILAYKVPKLMIESKLTVQHSWSVVHLACPIIS